jgi:glycosyltransferase involved in cell wall biosynthesis
MGTYDVLTISHLYPREDDPVYGRFVEQQTLELAKLDDVRVIAPVPWVPPLGAKLSAKWASHAAIDGAEARGGLRVLRPRYVALPRGFLLASSGRRLWSSIRQTLDAEWAKRPFDLIHAHVAVPDGAAGVIAARYFGVPLVLTVHGADVNVTLVRSPALHDLVVDTCNASDTTITVSTRLATELEEAGVRGGLLEVVANGIDPDEMAQVTPAGELASGRWVLAAGNLVNSKGYDDLIRAVSLLAPAYEDVRVAIVGSGPERHRLERLARELHLKDRIHFYGKQPPERLHRLMAAADVFVLPSWREGFGIVYLEAMALGRPVVGCRGQGIADVIEDGVNGLLAEPRHPDGLAAAIRKVLDDSDSAREMATKAQELVMTEYTWQVSAARVHQVYDKVMERKAEPPEGDG